MVDLLFQLLYTDCRIKIRFIVQYNCLSILQHFYDLFIIFIQCCGAVNHIKYQISLPGNLTGTGNSDFLHHILCLTDACSIHDFQSNPMKRNILLKDISCSTFNICYNGFIFPNKKVQQGGFACVWFTNNNSLNSLTDDFAVCGGFQQLFYGFLLFFHNPI